MRRREAIAALAGAAAWPLAAAAQIVRTKPARIGVLQWGPETAASLDRIEVLRLELRDLGYVEGRDIELDIRFAQETNERAAAIATEFTHNKVDVIVAAATPSVHAAKAATQDIAIVMSNVADPLATGLVKSLSRPGGNITGVTFIGPDVAPKRIALLREAVLGVKRIGFLGAISDPNTQTFLREIGSAAEAIGATLHPILVSGRSEFAGVFAEFVAQAVDGVMVQPLFIIDHSSEIAELALQHRLPTISDEARYARAGGLMSYGVEWLKLTRRAAHFIDKILKGVKPGDLPVEQPTAFELVINLKTARALGLDIPPTLLARADEVIE
jgi:putative ABC transport system substrate-binding protein